jgi:hypothetical protein
MDENTIDSELTQSSPSGQHEPVAEPPISKSTPEPVAEPPVEPPISQSKPVVIPLPQKKRRKMLIDHVITYDPYTEFLNKDKELRGIVDKLDNEENVFYEKPKAESVLASRRLRKLYSSISKNVRHARRLIQEVMRQQNKIK